MKKMVILIGLIIVTNVLSAYSQTLQNTTWSMYDNTGNLLGLCHFGNDTLSFKEDVEYNNVSTFKLNGNNFSIIDLTDFKCSNYTGKYTFIIQNDSLKFTLVNDSCMQRMETLTLFNFVRYQTGIQNNIFIPLVQLYPNPAGDEVLIKSDNIAIGTSFNIFDQLGRQIFSGSLTGESTKVDINQLSSGIYILQIGDNSKQTLKLIKK